MVPCHFAADRTVALPARTPQIAFNLPAHRCNTHEVESVGITKARDLLGYAPKYDMDEGIRRYVDWYWAARNESCNAG
jgi:nucleoside-diphosphate-sugar epimerase